MHVLYFHQHFSTPAGSTGTRSYEMARRLIAKGHEVTMVCGSYGGGKSGLSSKFDRGVRRGSVDGIEVVELQLPYSNYDSFLKRTWIFLLFALRSIHLAFPCRMISCLPHRQPLTAGIPGIMMKLFRNKPFVFEVRDLWRRNCQGKGECIPTLLFLKPWIFWNGYHTIRPMPASACRQVLPTEL